jgi:integrase
MSTGNRSLGDLNGIAFPNTTHLRPWEDPTCNFQITSFIAIGATSPSRFSELKWYLAPPLGVPTQLCILWDFPLNDGTSFADKEYSELRYAAKCFVWCILAPTVTSANGASSTAYASFYQLRSLLIWMHDNYIGRFQDITQDDLDEYLAHLRKRDITAATVGAALKVVFRLYRERRRLPDCFPFEPWHGLTAHEVADYNARRDTRTSKSLPDDVVNALYLGARRWTSEYASDIMALRRIVSDLPFARICGQSKYNAEMRRIRAEIQEFCFSILPGETAPWHTPIQNIDDTNELFFNFLAACYTIVAGFSGMRFHEVISLEHGCLRPNPEISADGQWEVWKLDGRSGKIEGSLKGEARDWVIGGRPVGSDFVLWCSDAIRALERFRKAGQVESGYLFTSPFSVRENTMWLGDLTYRLNRLLKSLFPAAEHATTHQFRHTFASRCVRYSSNAAPAIAQQFGHLQMGQLLGYINRDASLAAIFGKERARVMASDLVSMMSQQIAGPMHDEINPKRVRMLADFKSTDDFVRVISQLAKRDDLILVNSPWGICYYTKEHSACHGGDSGPHLANRNAKVCMGCKNIRVLEEHRGFHENRVAENEMLLAKYKKAAAIVKVDWFERARESRLILEQLSASMLS